MDCHLHGNEELTGSDWVNAAARTALIDTVTCCKCLVIVSVMCDVHPSVFIVPDGVLYE